MAPNRRLFHVPIIHSEADMGALAGAFRRALVSKVGEQGRKLNLNAVDRIWTAIEQKLAALNLRYELVHIYQDGLPVCGHELRIVTALARAGSRNHQLLLRLHQRGARIMGTESPELLVEEYQRTKRMLANAPHCGPHDQELARALLKRRDEFIAARINATLQPGQTAILFLGLLHSVEGKLAPDIEVSKLFSEPAPTPE